MRSIGNEHDIGNALDFHDNRDDDIGVGLKEKTKSIGNEVGGKQARYRNRSPGYISVKAATLHWERHRQTPRS